MKLPTFCALCLAAVVAGESARAQGFTYRKIMDTNTPVPGGGASFGAFTPPILTGGRVIFSAGAGTFLAAPGSALVKILGNDFYAPDSPPASPKKFVGFSVTDAEGSELVAAGLWNSFSYVEQGIYRATTGTLSTIVSTTSTTQNFFSFGSPVISAAGNVAFYAIGHAPNFQLKAGIYLADATGARTVIEESLSNDVGSNDLGYTVAMSGEAIAYARGDALKIWKGGVSNVIVRTNLLGRNYAGFSGLCLSGENLGFYGDIYDARGVLTFSRIFTANLTKATPIVDTKDKFPGTRAKFRSFGGSGQNALSLSGENVAFVGFNSNDILKRPASMQGIYLARNKHVTTVVDLNTRIDGKKIAVPSNVSTAEPFGLASRGLEGESVAFTVQFADGTFGMYVAEPIPTGLVVNSTGDADNVHPGDGIASTGALLPDGHAETTLRAAITEANAAPGRSTITFKIPGPGPYRIAPDSALPVVKNRTIIDATTQPGFGFSPIVQLDGVNASGADGLAITGGNCTVRGLVIQNYFRGLFINGPKGRNRIAGNYFGTDVNGINTRENVRAIVIENSAHNTIGGGADLDRNVISGSFGDGLTITGALAKLNEVRGNYIGLDRDGTLPIPNQTGVVIEASVGNLLANNVIAGNSVIGVHIRESTSRSNRLEGNLIGTNAAGLAPIANGLAGVSIEDASSTRIGGNTAERANVISGNSVHGISISGKDAQDNEVQGNLIGTNLNGTAALPNGGDGVHISEGSFNVIGGSAASRNFISGNGGSGVSIDGAKARQNVISANYIGTNRAGNASLGNADGVALTAAENMIGGAKPAMGNVISGNRSSGIDLSGTGAFRNEVLRNYLGLDGNGSVKIPNANHGISISDAPENRIGDPKNGLGNVISGNGANGLRIRGAAARDNRVHGNFIGTDATGLLAQGNTLDGVLIDGAPATVIGAEGAAGNLISANTQRGIQVKDAPDTRIQGNFIGVTNRRAALGNLLHGILVTGDADHTLIGGLPRRADNTIAFGGQDGIHIATNPGRTTAILRNAIYDNQQLGIKYEGASPAAPQITGARTGGGRTRIEGLLSAKTSTRYRIEFFANLVPDGSGFGEGREFLGFANIQTDGAGAATFAAAAKKPSVNIAATATELGGGAPLATSAFSNCFAESSLRLRSFAPVAATPPSVIDAAGNVITARTSGAGSAVFLLNDEASAPEIALEGTDENSTLTVRVRKSAFEKGAVEIGGITGGTLRAIDARTADLTGAGIQLEGWLGRLLIHDIRAGAAVVAGGDSTQPTRIAAHAIGDNVRIQLGSRLARLSAAGIGAGKIVAPAIGSIVVTGDARAGLAGDFEASVTVAGTAADFERLDVKGAVRNATIQVDGRLGRSPFAVPARRSPRALSPQCKSAPSPSRACRPAPSASPSAFSPPAQSTRCRSPPRPSSGTRSARPCSRWVISESSAIDQSRAGRRGRDGRAFNCSPGQSVPQARWTFSPVNAEDSAYQSFRFRECLRAFRARLAPATPRGRSRLPPARRTFRHAGGGRDRMVRRGGLDRFRAGVLLRGHPAARVRSQRRPSAREFVHSRLSGRGTSRGRAARGQRHSFARSPRDVRAAGARESAPLRCAGGLDALRCVAVHRRLPCAGGLPALWRKLPSLPAVARRPLRFARCPARRQTGVARRAGAHRGRHHPMARATRPGRRGLRRLGHHASAPDAHSAPGATRRQGSRPRGTRNFAHRFHTALRG